MKNDQLNSSSRLSVVGCLRYTKGLPFSYLPTLALAIALTLLVTPFLSAQQRWARTYGGATDDEGNSVQQTTDGGYIVAGETFSFGNGCQVYLIKTDASGDTLWTRTYGGAGSEGGNSVQQTSDGGYIVAGWTDSFPNSSQTHLIKTSASGVTLWTKTYGGAGNDLGYSVQQTLDGGYIVAGTYDNLGTDPQVYLIKTDTSGDTLWTRTYGGLNFDYGYSVQQTSDGGYVVAGVTGSFGDDFQAYLVKTNGSGDTLWTRTYGGINQDWGSSVQQTSDGGYVIAGRTSSFGRGGYDIYLIKTNASGDTLWTRTYGGTDGDYGKSVKQTLDTGYVIVGITSSFGAGWSDLYLIKTDVNGNVGVETEEVRGQRLEVRIKTAPNPFTTFATVPGQEKETFELYDIAGRKVGTYKGDRIGANLPAGVYFLGTSGKTTTPMRIVKVR